MEQVLIDDRITFDAAWTKMGLHHDIPRTPLVDRVLEAAKHFQRTTTDLVFPSWKKNGARISGFSQLMKQLIDIARNGRFMLHTICADRCARSCHVAATTTTFSGCVSDKNRKASTPSANKDEQRMIRKMASEATHSNIAAVIGGKRTDDVVRLQRAQNPPNRIREHHASSE